MTHSMWYLTMLLCAKCTEQQFCTTARDLGKNFFLAGESWRNKCTEQALILDVFLILDRQ